MKILISLFLFTISLYASSISVFKVEAMHCPLCTTAVKKAIKKLDGIQKVSARLNTKKVTVTYDSKKVKIEDILKAIKTTSYEGVLITTTLK
jgi:periplasmic mercuric ion binding protein